MRHRPHFLCWLAIAGACAVLPGLSFAASADAASALHSHSPETAMSQPLPPLFGELVAFDREQHRHLKLPVQRRHFAFAARNNLLPVTVAEVGQVLRHYPLVFISEGDTVALVAVASVVPGHNAFIGTKNQWRPGVYIPAYVRGYPFVALRPRPDAEPILALDPGAEDFRVRGGQPLLGADDQPGEQLRGIMAFHADYRVQSERTQLMARALREAGVLEAGSLQLAQPGGEARRIEGFLVVSEAKLRALPAEALKRLIDADAIGLAYAQLLSMASVANLLEDGHWGPNDTATATASPKKASRRSAKQVESEQ